MPGYAPDELIETLWPQLGGLRFTPGYWTSTDWDGDAKNGASGVIDLSAVFGMPAGIKAISCQLWILDETVNVSASINNGSGTPYGILQFTPANGVYSGVAGVVGCDANGDIRFDQSGELDAVYLFITGYWS